ncbi:MAG: tRNA (5-methylaminomethyl-2-thiouridylate)-methyltransferase, partial [Bacteroidia bacterium]|nr:tRNA (5-methylaminomethyl-2-thiouridylate)-methyltransferase [Bacteroidia bacterium]
MNSTSPERYAIVPTADGSPTIYDTLFHAHFHSLHGALTESRHVFIRNGLEYFINKFPHISHIRIFEFGFGSGLNAFLTLQKVRDLNNINVTY